MAEVPPAFCYAISTQSEEFDSEDDHVFAYW